MDSGRSDGRCAQVVKFFGQVNLTDIGTEHVKDCAPMVAESDGYPSQTEGHLKAARPGWKYLAS